MDVPTVQHDDIRVYKMGRGESFDERVTDVEAFLREHYTVSAVETRTVEVDGVDVEMVSIVPENAALNALHAGAVRYPNKKTGFAVAFDEADPHDVAAEDAEDFRTAIDAKNEMLLAATGRDAEARRDQLKREAKD